MKIRLKSGASLLPVMILGTACAAEGGTPPRVVAQPTPVLSEVEQSELREQALASLVDAASSNDAQTRANAIEGLLQAPTRLAPILPAALSDTNVGVRSVAAVAAGRIKWCDQPALLEALLSDPSDFVRASALFALARCNQTSDLTPLAALLFNGPTTGPRAHAAYLLGELGNPSALPMLRQAANSRVPRASDVEMKLLQLQIAEAMFKLGDDSQLPTLHGALYVARPEDLEATVLAAQILGQIGSRKSTHDLVNLIAWEDETKAAMPAEVRLAAAGALGQIGSPAHINGKPAPRPESVAGEYLDSPVGAIRAQCAAVLGFCGGPATIAPLTRLWEDPDTTVRVAAASALVRVLTDAR